jgi:hypothetical protein
MSPRAEKNIVFPRHGAQPVDGEQERQRVRFLWDFAGIQGVPQTGFSLESSNW